jgi:hypothetical protein
VSPWMVPRLIWIGDVVEKWAPLIEVEDSTLMLPMSSMVFGGDWGPSLGLIILGGLLSQMHF